MKRSTPDENSIALDGKGAIRHASGWKRALLAALGIVFVGIAGIGVLLPGIPTVGPLLVASLFLLKSSHISVNCSSEEIHLDQRVICYYIFMKSESKVT